MQCFFQGHTYFVHNFHMWSTGRSPPATWCIQCQLRCIGRFWCHFDLTFDKNVTLLTFIDLHQICPRHPFSIFDSYYNNNYYFDVHNGLGTRLMLALINKNKTHRSHSSKCLLGPLLYGKNTFMLKLLKFVYIFLHSIRPQIIIKVNEHFFTIQIFFWGLIHWTWTKYK